MLVVGVILALEWLAAVIFVVRQPFDLADFGIFSKGVFASQRRIVGVLLLGLYRRMSAYREGTTWQYHMLFLSLSCLMVFFGGRLSRQVIDFLLLFRWAYSTPAGGSLINHLIGLRITVYPMFLGCFGLPLELSSCGSVLVLGWAPHIVSISSFWVYKLVWWAIVSLTNLIIVF